MDNLDPFLGRAVLITGATGFIGSRLASRLTKTERAIVTGTGRNLSGFVHGDRYTVKPAEILDRQALWEAIRGNEVVFHLAGWMGNASEASRAEDLNVTGTKNVIELASVAGVKRVVFVSSVAAYGFSREGEILEDTPVDTNQEDLYGKTKAMAEVEGFALARELGIEFTVLRPGMVYGPQAKVWTLAPLKLIQEGNPIPFGDGMGHAFPVYIENLIDALLLAAMAPEAAGEAFNLCDPSLSMGEFLDYYGKMCGRQPRRRSEWAGKASRPFNKFLDLGLPVTEERMNFYALKSRYPAKKASKILGYHPEVSIDEGMRHTEAWLRESGHLAQSA